MTAVSPRVLVVIPCLNEIHHLPGLLAHLRQDRGAKDHLIIVADGGSTDGTAEAAAAAAASDPQIVVLQNEKRLQAAAVNLAAQRFHEGAAFIVRVDAHADYPADYVSSLVAAAEATGADSVVVSMRSVGRGCFGAAAAAAQNSRLGTGGSAHRRPSEGRWIDHGHHALFRTKSFLDLGGYDEAFAANEDAEYDVRLGRAGGRIWLSETSIVYYTRTSVLALWRQYARNGAGRATTMAKHKVAPKVRQMIPIFILPIAGLAVLTPVFPPAGLGALVWGLASLGFGAALGVRARSLCVGASGAAALIMHLAWSAGYWRRLISIAMGARRWEAGERGSLSAGT